MGAFFEHLRLGPVFAVFNALYNALAVKNAHTPTPITPKPQNTARTHNILDNNNKTRDDGDSDDLASKIKNDRPTSIWGGGLLRVCYLLCSACCSA
jgi:hypothetical protein